DAQAEPVAESAPAREVASAATPPPPRLASTGMRSDVHTNGDPTRTSSPDAASSSYRQNDRAEAAFADGWKALDRGELEHAEKAFQRAASEQNGRLNEDASFWRAVTLARAGNRDRAISAFSEFLERYPESPRRGEASVLLGRLLLASGDARGAERRFGDAASDRRPDVRDAAKRGREDVAPPPGRRDPP